MYDAIIVGARCAGSPTAMLLARKGYRTLVLDRDEFPSDIMSTHFIQAQGVAQLTKWGLIDAVDASGCPPIHKMTMRLGDLAMSPPNPENARIAVCPRRTVLDKILVDAARSAGAEVREGASVQELTFDDGRVTGVKARSRDGATFTEQAKIVIGADGMHSSVAKSVGAEEYDVTESLTCGYYAYFSGVEMDGGELCMHNGVGLLGFPTHEGNTCIAVMRPHDDFHNFRSDIEGNFAKHAAAAAPSLAERVAAGKREERFVGTADTRNFRRKPYGPGWALVGDAGYHRDPVTGLGISDAFCDVERLTDAIDDGFAGRMPLDDAMARYHRERDAATEADYQRTMFLARFPSREEVLAAMQAQAPAAV